MPSLPVSMPTGPLISTYHPKIFCKTWHSTSLCKISEPSKLGFERERFLVCSLLSVPAKEQDPRNQVFHGAGVCSSDRPIDLSQPQRQQLYLRALATLPKVSVHLGHFLVHEVTMPLVVAPGQPQQYVGVINTEEMGSDVNLATHLLHDAHRDRFDVAVVVSNL